MLTLEDVTPCSGLHSPFLSVIILGHTQCHYSESYFTLRSTPRSHWLLLLVIDGAISHRLTSLRYPCTSFFGRPYRSYITPMPHISLCFVIHSVLFSIMVLGHWRCDFPNAHFAPPFTNPFRQWLSSLLATVTHWRLISFEHLRRSLFGNGLWSRALLRSDVSYCSNVLSSLLSVVVLGRRSCHFRTSLFAPALTYPSGPFSISIIDVTTSRRPASLRNPSAPLVCHGSWSLVQLYYGVSTRSSIYSPLSSVVVFANKCWDLRTCHCASTSMYVFPLLLLSIIDAATSGSLSFVRHLPTILAGDESPL